MTPRFDSGVLTSLIPRIRAPLQAEHTLRPRASAEEDFAEAGDLGRLVIDQVDPAIAFEVEVEAAQLVGDGQLVAVLGNTSPIMPGLPT